MVVCCDSSKIPLSEKSVHCVITSPPYWGLRDYGTAKWDGGSLECDHKVPFSTAGGGSNKAHNGSFEGYRGFKDICGKCGAIRVDNQLGLESTPEEYIGKMVEVGREVWRVLRDDGTVWLNMGDSYCSTAPGTNGDPLHARGILSGVSDRRAEASRKYRPETPVGLKPKDLVGIPWRLAFALQADGWYLRSDIIWAKPNPMPESVTDRPTKSHEYIFLLTKSPKYFFDQEAVREKYKPDSEARVLRGRSDNHKWADGGPGDHTLAKDLSAACSSPNGRNIRTVWEIATQPFSGAHFATFPEELVRRCLFAGTSDRGCCPKCGGPWVRMVEKPDMENRPRRSDGSKCLNEFQGATSAGQKYQEWRDNNPNKTIGWKPSCDCGEEKTVPAVVLDPFFGAGTVGVVAQKYNRRFVGLELKMDYCRMAKRRLEGTNVAML